MTERHDNVTHVQFPGGVQHPEAGKAAAEQAGPPPVETDPGGMIPPGLVGVETVTTAPDVPTPKIPKPVAKGFLHPSMVGFRPKLVAPIVDKPETSTPTTDTRP